MLNKMGSLLKTFKETYFTGAPEIMRQDDFNAKVEKNLKKRKPAMEGLSGKYIMHADGKIYQMLHTGWRRRQDIERLVALKKKGEI